MRLDQYIASIGKARSRNQAQQLIRAGLVNVNGQIIKKTGQQINLTDHIEVVEDPWVSRAAHKLLGALEDLQWPEIASRVLDAGASTGGFTQVLLTRGAKKVYAVDVGHEQLDPSLRRDPRVAVREGLNLRNLKLSDLDGQSVGLIVADVSFISLKLLIQPFSQVLADDGWALLMVKPQFEVGKDRLGAGGVVVDEKDRLAAVNAVIDQAMRFGWKNFWCAETKLPGPAGNREYFVAFKPVGSKRG